MKVALIDVNCKHSSTGKIVYDLYTELNKNGHEAAVFYGRGPKIKEKNIFKFGFDLETYFHAFMTRITGFTGVFSPFSTYRVIRKLKKFKPDIVHIHELHAYFINLKPIMNYLKNSPIKVIWTFHCEFMFTGKCAITYDCNKWQTECHKCPQVKEYPKSLIFDFSSPMFRQKKELFKDFNNLTIVTPSKWLADKVALSFLRDKDCLIIPNGINQKIFKNMKSTNSYYFDFIDSSKTIVLSVANNILSDNKGGNRIIELAEKLEDKNFQFILVGDKKPSNINGDNIYFVERVDNQKSLAALYNLSSIYLSLSKSESFSQTSLEALSCGLPVVGYDSGGIVETTLRGYGHFTNFGNQDGVEEILINLQKGFHFEKNKKVISNLYHKIHASERMTKDYLNLYSKSLL